MSRENMLSAWKASSMVTRIILRLAGSMVVSQSCSAIISPKPL